MVPHDTKITIEHDGEYYIIVVERRKTKRLYLRADELAMLGAAIQKELPAVEVTAIRRGA